MTSHPVANPEYLIVQTTKRTIKSTRRRKAAPPSGTSSMFNNANHTRIKDSSFVLNTTNVNPDTKSSLDVLYKHVAPNAILNAGGRADEVRCHPGTRQEVIGRIEKWRADAEGGLTGSRMFWLSGPFGAGKSAIVQTVAENWTSHGIHTANFFFFRTDPSRNHANSFVSTLLYQIFDFYPAARGAVEKILASKPRILEASIKEQFDQLLCSALYSIEPSFSQSFVLLIDGLDECDSEHKTSQRQILQALDTLVGRNDLPFLVLVASRVEHQITMAFNQVCSKADSIFLDDQYSPRKDIHLFVTAAFDKIKTTHHLAHTLDEDWPSVSDVDGIVAKSSGQFIYAATVMRFISDSSASPKLSLRRVQGIAQAATSSPFSQLDALYTYILLREDDQQTLKDILHAQFLIIHLPVQTYGSFNATLQGLLCLYNRKYTDSSVIHSCIVGVTAIARFEGHKLLFYHASLEDYFQDQSRSGEYFVDIDAFIVKFLPRLLEHDSPDGSASPTIRQCLLRLKTMTPDIMNALLAPRFLGNITVGIHPIGDILKNLHHLCTCNDDVENYKQFLQEYMIQYVSWSFKFKSATKKLHDIPYGQRYFMMAHIELLHGHVAQNPDIVVDALRSESESDIHETTMWVQNLLQRIHKEYYPCHLGTYKRLMAQWIFWAILNDIGLTDLYSLPYGQWYFWQGTVAKWVTSYLKRSDR